ncbi:hypothetical protein B4Q13_24165, partial [Lacticaseibacillus rhamnosus]
RKLGYEVAFCGKARVPGHFRDKTGDDSVGFQGQGNYRKPVIAESTPEGKIGPDKPYDGFRFDEHSDESAQSCDTWCDLEHRDGRLAGLCGGGRHQYGAGL